MTESTTLSLRTWQKSDVQQVASIFALSCIDTYSNFFPPICLELYTDSIQYTRWKGYYDSKTSKEGFETVVAMENGTVLGFVQIGPVDDPADCIITGDTTTSDPTRTAELHYLFVHPTALGKGIGKTLLQHAEVRMKEEGYMRTILHVFLENEKAVGFYRKMGWRGTGRVTVHPLLLEFGKEVFWETYEKDLV